MIILLHSSKTMRPSVDKKTALRQPQLIAQTKTLAAYLKTLSPEQLAATMHISGALAAKTHQTIAGWTTAPDHLSLALDCFVGDIYKGLRAATLSQADRGYADKTLLILSGLYGCIRPYDGICPYRLEMMYRLPDPTFTDLYKYWGDSIARCLPPDDLIVNVSSVEYSQTVTRFVDPSRVVAPNFLTINPASGEPVFVVVHAKIARGAFARWLITSRITDAGQFAQFDALGYQYSKKLSTPQKPTFVCQTFTGTAMGV
ncbi:MAG: YaaA family protein, partial [Candidatus Saccharimonadales bacterium]